jgi:hypothetical protein
MLDQAGSPRCSGISLAAVTFALAQTVVSAWSPSLLRQPGGYFQTRLLASFDFSSPSEWDSFYIENEDTFEWHSSIALDTISSFVPSDADCLMVGCGNSKLPAAVLSTCENPRIVLLDTSKTCLKQLEQVYGSAVKYQCGDASKLADLWDTPSFDIIVDKGLTDAVLCGEGWDGILERVFEDASRVLREDSGVYLLISYKLPSSTKEFIREVGGKVGLDWKFDLPESNDRVGVSLATRVGRSTEDAF